MASNYSAHNQKVLQNVRCGDLLEFKRGIYSHWGVAVGNGRVIHFSGEWKDYINSSAQKTCTCLRKKAIVMEEDFWDVVKNSKAYINNLLDTQYTPETEEQIVLRARSLVGSDNYDIVFNNCEHFVTLCRYRKKKSKQVIKAVKIVGGIAAVFGTIFVLAGVIFSAISSSSRRNNNDVDDD